MPQESVVENARKHALLARLCELDGDVAVGDAQQRDILLGGARRIEPQVLQRQRAVRLALLLVA